MQGKPRALKPHSEKLGTIGAKALKIRILPGNVAYSAHLFRSKKKPSFARGLHFLKQSLTEISPDFADFMGWRGIFGDQAKIPAICH
jgi:hypothetical protein